MAPGGGGKQVETIEQTGGRLPGGWGWEAGGTRERWGQCSGWKARGTKGMLGAVLGLESPSYEGNVRGSARAGKPELRMRDVGDGAGAGKPRAAEGAGALKQPIAYFRTGWSFLPELPERH